MCLGSKLRPLWQANTEASRSAVRFPRAVRNSGDFDYKRRIVALAGRSPTTCCWREPGPPTQGDPPTPPEPSSAQTHNLKSDIQQHNYAEFFITDPIAHQRLSRVVRSSPSSFQCHHAHGKLTETPATQRTISCNALHKDRAALQMRSLLKPAAAAFALPPSGAAFL